jgi:flavin reductase (DIM6/NTAB) family NADH-FMN oxidoreductase RutF
MPGQSHGGITMGSGGGRPPRRFEALDGGNLPGPPAMRALRREHAAGVTVVTAVEASGFRGTTVTAFTFVSIDPPRVLVCLGTGSDVLTAITASGRFAVSLLSDTQEFLADRFAGRAPLVNRQFAGVLYRLTKAGNPVLEAALAWLDCTVDHTIPGGDHLIVIGQVVEAGYGTGTAPLLYFDGAYRYLDHD